MAVARKIGGVGREGYEFGLVGEGFLCKGFQ